MTFTHMTRAHIAHLQTRRILADMALSNALQDPARQHLLPGLLRDSSDALAALVDFIGGSDPAITQALAVGVRDTRQLQHPIDYPMEVQP